jgi:hypothetical protein
MATFASNFASPLITRLGRACDEPLAEISLLMGIRRLGRRQEANQEPEHKSRSACSARSALRARLRLVSLSCAHHQIIETRHAIGERLATTVGIQSDQKCPRRPFTLWLEPTSGCFGSRRMARCLGDVSPGTKREYHVKFGAVATPASASQRRASRRLRAAAVTPSYMHILPSSSRAAPTRALPHSPSVELHVHYARSRYGDMS